MVLSNKKLKQKLKEVKSESLASSISGVAVSHSNGKTDTVLELQERLEAARQKTRLVKKDKRRSSRGPETEEKGSINGKKEQNENNDKESGDGKKRKREEEQSSDKVEKKAKMTKKKKKKKTAVKNKKNKANANANANANGGDDNVNVAIDGGASKEEMSGIVQSSVIKDIATKVYVGGIPYYSTEDDIRSFFDSCGTITEVDCMKFPDSGKFRGIAIINFKTDAAAKRALDLDGADMGGFFLKVRPYKTSHSQQTKVPDFVPHVVKGYNRIYVGNLSWDITEENLRNFFADCKISSIRFGMDKETGEFRGYGHVDFSDDVSMMMALKMDQHIVCGRPIKISCAVPKKAADAHAIKEASKPEVDSTPITIPITIDARHNDEMSTISTVEVVRNEASSIEGQVPVSGKIKRRTCYECGQKGHISSACPNKPNTDVSTDDVSMMSLKMAGPRTTFEEAVKPEVDSTPITIPIINKARDYDEFSTMSTFEVVRNEGIISVEAPVPASGKIKRRTCYECGQKGHISTACPTKQNTDVTNPSTV
ncbi:Phragmoplastin interacting protein 1 [Linum grandiflorum]